MKMRIGLLAASGSAIAIAAGAAVTIAQRAASAPTLASAEAPTPPDQAYRSPVAPERRRAFFGELHLHTTMSFDAWSRGSRVTPDVAYRFARGETVMVPADQASREMGVDAHGDAAAKRAWPLDFAAVTDHSEYLGAMRQLENPQSAFSTSPTGQALKTGGRKAFFMVGAAIEGEPSSAAADLRAAARAADGWTIEKRAANANYRPGKFTTFVAYEWTASPGMSVHMHRNVIFNAPAPPEPFTALQSRRPEDLWKFLDSVRARGIDVIAIPHNSNLSDGHDFDWNMSDGRPIDEAYALERAVNEPLVEMAQTKGSSETTPELSPSDEFADFEIVDRLYRGETSPKQHGSYVREGWGRGLVIQSQVGANPFKMGVVGASDLHTGLSVSDENATGNGPYIATGNGAAPLRRGVRAILNDGRNGVRPSGMKEDDPLQHSSAAITGVWAEENTRNSIFAALKRKETFATSGTRIRLRMFGGWTLGRAMLRKPDWVARVYAAGVPMGSDLPAARAAWRAPSFIVQATKDPDGANLDRIQIVKVWLDGQGYREKVYDVALSGGRKDNAAGRAPPVGNTVDLKTGRYANTIGAAAFTTAWSDPDFDPRVPAVYYARALEIPTPRWSTLLAIRSGVPVPKRAPATIQERAWSSPIWFTPPGFGKHG